MHRWIAIFSFAVVYYAVVWYGLYVFDAGLVVTGLFLYGIPGYLLAHYSYAPTPVVLSVACLGLGLGIILESTAHIYGLWYTLGADSTRFLGLVPVEMLIVIVFQTIFLALLYELFFDDGVYTPSSGRTRMTVFVVFGLAAVGFLVAYQLWFAELFLEYSFVWLLVILGACMVAALGVYRAYSIQFFDRMIWFALLGAVPGAIGLALSITNVHKIFANPEQYLFALTILGETVALEELLMIIGLPFLVGTIYELYLDDRA